MKSSVKFSKVSPPKNNDYESIRQTYIYTLNLLIKMIIVSNQNRVPQSL